MRLRVTVEDPTARRRTHVTLLAEPDSPAVEALAAIARTAGTDKALWDERQALGTEGTLATAGLHDGAVLGAGAPGRPTRDLVDRGIELRVIGGPAAGLVFRLAVGRTVLGRQESCAVAIPDPEMSREHAALVIAPDGSMTVADLGSSNGTAVEGVAVDVDPVPCAHGEVIQVGASFVSVLPVDPLDGALSDDGRCGYVFNRRYRIRRPAPAVEIEYPQAPKEEEKAGFPWLMMAAPLVVAVGMAAVLKQAEYLLLAVMSPVMTLGSTMNDRRTRKRHGARAATEFTTKTDEADRQARDALNQERIRRRADSPDPATLALAAMGPRGRLWERRAADVDHLVLRVGLATLPSEVRLVNVTSPPPAWAVPVTVPLPAVGVLGVAGPPEVGRAAARTLVLQTAALHSPDDVRVVVLTDSSVGAEWDWVRWLPHSQLDQARGIVAVGNDPETVTSRVKELQRLVVSRTEQQAGHGAGASQYSPAVLVVVDGAKRQRSLPGMLTVLQQGPSVGVYTIGIDEDRSLLPEESGAVVTFDQVSGMASVEQHGLPSVEEVALDLCPPHLCESTARAMAPIHRIGGETAGDGIPDSARLAELTGLDPPTAVAIEERWRAPDRGPRAVLGVAEHGPLVLDLATDGPHGLVAGTTGAGKSELLQSLVAGLAVSSPPDELNVVLVDYKGGAAFRDCTALPHTVGMVTDLDAHLTERALRSLQAELKRREHMLAAAGTKDIGDYHDARARTRSTLPPLPRLVIVMDEFASLAVELPDFIKGLVGIAQRGRSLGVHLVLATQRPTGVVSPEIRANANFAIALRVVSGAESSDVIGVPVAATISPATPGRAYLRISQEPPVCFQTARVGGRRPGVLDTATAVNAYAVPWTSLGTPDPAAPTPHAPPDEATDLHELVETIVQAASARGVASQRKPWLDALPEVLTLDPLLASPAEPTTTGVPPLPFGLYDLPDRQEQLPACFDPAAGRHLLVAGSPRSGRTSVLRSVASVVARSCTVDTVHLYGIDCGNGSLLPLRDLPQSGALVARSETDRVERLLGRLSDEVRRRQAVLVQRGMSSAVEQRADPGDGSPWPYLVLLVDGWEGFLDAFHDHKDGAVEQLLLGLLRAGGPVGLTVVMTGDRSLISTSRVSSLFEDRFVLRFNDRDDYSLADLAPRKMPEKVPPGRAFRAVTGDELQVALLATDPTGPAQAAALVDLAGQASERAAGLPAEARPFRVDPLPAQISLGEAMALDRSPTATAGAGRGDARSPLCALVGVGGDELGPLWVNLAELGPGFVVTGSPESGRSTSLFSMGSALLDRGCRVVAVAPRPGPLQALQGREGAAVLDGGAARSPAAEGPAAAEALLATAGGGDTGRADHRPLAVLVDDAELVDPDDTWLVGLASGHPGEAALIVAGALEPLRDGFRGFPLHAKHNGCGLLLSPRSHLDAAVFNATLPRGGGFTGPPGRGYLFTRSRLVGLLQVPVP